MILNLMDLEHSPIKYKISKFPDGQQNITIISENPRRSVQQFGQIYNKFDVTIKSRLNNWLDLELIVASVASLKELGFKLIHLYVPYFVGARSDRKFEEGGNWYLKQVICPVINSLKFESVTVLDAHSSVLGNLLDNYKAIDNIELINFALDDLIWRQKEIKSDTPKNSLLENIVLVSPDAGASHKIQKIADKIGYTGDIITCRKERDTDGKLTKTAVPMNEDYPGKSFVIIDDICDGGRTFINIAKEIKAFFKDQKIYLIVTHGIFSAGFKELSQYFDGIFTTNSYQSVEDEVYSNRHRVPPKDFVKQLNVF